MLLVDLDRENRLENYLVDKHDIWGDGSAFCYGVR